MSRMKPKEIWVIQVTPWSRGFEPKTIADVNDRCNELSGNIAISQDIYLIEKIDELVDAKAKAKMPRTKGFACPERRVRSIGTSRYE